MSKTNSANAIPKLIGTVIFIVVGVVLVGSLVGVVYAYNKRIAWAFGLSTLLPVCLAGFSGYHWWKDRPLAMIVCVPSLFVCAFFGMLWYYW